MYFHIDSTIFNYNFIELGFGARVVAGPGVVAFHFLILCIEIMIQFGDNKIEN